MSTRLFPPSSPSAVCLCLWRCQWLLLPRTDGAYGRGSYRGSCEEKERQSKRRRRPGTGDGQRSRQEVEEEGWTVTQLLPHNQPRSPQRDTQGEPRALRAARPSSVSK